MLHTLVYMSAATVPFSDEDLEQLLEASRRRNTAAGLSGLLVFSDGRFMQLLEGPYDAVLATYARVLGDGRHTDVALLVEEPTHTRRFPDWAMAYDRDGASAPLDGFSSFLTVGDTSADESRARELLRWFRGHPLADPRSADDTV